MCVRARARAYAQACVRDRERTLKMRNSAFVITSIWKACILIVTLLHCGILGVVCRADVFLPLIN